MRTIVWRVTLLTGLVVMAAALTAYGGYHNSPPAGSPVLDQLKTAQSHSTFAAQGETIAGVRSHLAHVVNCLQGPRGADFNASEGTPCQGNGIIPDLTRQGAAAAKALGSAREANAAALDALKQAALAQAKAGAAKVANLLGTALKELPQ